LDFGRRVRVAGRLRLGGTAERAGAVWAMAPVADAAITGPAATAQQEIGGV
jgi:hypothetical protein